MKVYIVFPFNRIDSKYYTYLIKYPPEKVKYLNKINEGIILSKREFKKFLDIKSYVKKIGSKIRFNFPLIKKINLDVDLLHAARIFLYTDLPYVMDIEFSTQLIVSRNRDKFSDKIIGKLIGKNNLKKILPWTYTSLLTFPEEIRKKYKEKFEIIYPAVPEPEVKKIKHDKINLLFVGRYFYGKGGHYVLEIFKELKKKYDIECTFISLTIPEKIKEKYEKYGIKIYYSVSDEELYNKIFPSTDIFVYPGLSDSFGFAIAESLSYGIPVITYDGFSKREIIEDGKSGFVIYKNKNPLELSMKLDKEVLDEFIKRTEELIEDDKMRKEFSRNSYRIYREKLSIEVRNRKIKKVYEESIKK